MIKAFLRLLLFSVLATTIFSGNAIAQIDVNGYKYAVIPDASTGDDRGIGALIRQAASSSGLEVFSTVDQLGEAKIAETCVVSWSYQMWGAPPVGAKVFVTVRDFVTNEHVAKGSGNGWVAFTADSNLRTAIKHAWSDIRYRGYSLATHEKNLKTIKIPQQDVITVDEAAFRKRSNFAPVEGVWASPDNRYVLIVTVDEGKLHGDYVGVILSTTNPLYQKGEIKMQLRETAVPTVFVGDYFTTNKQKQGVTFVIEKEAMLKFTFRNPIGGTTDAMFIRLFPKIDSERQHNVTAQSRLAEIDIDRPKASGSGTIVSVKGHILTAAHVVAGATKVAVVTASGRQNATVLRIDETNDVAVLKIDGGPYVPLPVAPSRHVRLGQTVATIGFPNVQIQGFSPKVTRGEISSLNGIGDDPRSWQISAPVQPGNSGGPLLDEDGNLIGVIVSKLGLNAASAIGDLPQNVNYAVKSAYALALLEPFLDNTAPEPNQPNPKQSFADMVAATQESVVLVLVY